MTGDELRSSAAGAGAAAALLSNNCTRALVDFEGGSPRDVGTGGDLAPSPRILGREPREDLSSECRDFDLWRFKAVVVVVGNDKGEVK